jgi:hypothetical protein
MHCQHLVSILDSTVDPSVPSLGRPGPRGDWLAHLLGMDRLTPSATGWAATEMESAQDAVGAYGLKVVLDGVAALLDER